MLRAFLLAWLIVFLRASASSETLLASQTEAAEAYAYALSTRYAPFASWAAQFEVDHLKASSEVSYWKTASVIRAARAEGALPLSGLHLALDPGHIGGVWAEAEGRDFKIQDSDFSVREGELVLEVAQRVCDQLVALGAEVTLLREAAVPVNPKAPVDYLERAMAQVERPEVISFDSLMDYAWEIRARAIRLSIIVGELVERARLVSQVIQPDALISLHINAAPWPVVEAEPSANDDQPLSLKKLQLVRSNHLHVLIFGCLSDAELRSPRQQAQLIAKLTNGSGPEEQLLGGALAEALAEATALPAAVYEGENAVRLEGKNPYLWARNLMLLRMVECPVVLLEPHVANSKQAYARIQAALSTRALGAPLADDDILVEYADAVVAGVRRAYASDTATD